jgi:glycerol-3-phosphate dehydrogenase
MKRKPANLADHEFDVLVVGAGINGVCIARDAATRGLTVALVDRSDLGSGTSFNSLRIVHGGLRYLQHLDFRRMRQSIRERSTWLRIAPHLVHTLPFMAATSGKGTRSRTAFRAALAMNDLIGFDRNRNLAPSRRIPGGRVLGRKQALKHYPGSDADHITGGAFWYDAQMYHSERLVIGIAESAAQAGAEIANYIEINSLAVDGQRVTGANARDLLTGESFDIRASVVVNATGPAIGRLIRNAAASTAPRPVVRLSRAMNILTRPIAGETAVGVPGRHLDPNAKVEHGARLLFVTPWRGLSLIGTTHTAYDGRPEDFRPTEQDVAEFVDEINEAVPDAKLTLDDVRFVYAGLLPAADPCPGDADVRLLQHHRVIDHVREDGLQGFISLVGVKYTTARLAAEEIVNLVFAKLNRTAPACSTDRASVPGAAFDSFEDFTAGEEQVWDERIDGTSLRQLVRLYGTQLRAVLDCCSAPAGERISQDVLLSAQTRHAVRAEMAVKLSDVVFRRTDVASRGRPGADVQAQLADTMAEETGWDDSRRAQELAEVGAAFDRWKNSRKAREPSLSRSRVGN